MAVTNFKDITSIGNIALGDKLLGERVDGTTVRVTFNGIVLDSEFGTNGLMIRTGAGTYTNAVITGVTNRTTVTNGSGVSGNPTIDISASYVGQTSLTTLGTITTGTWNGTLVGMTYGGTGANLSPSNGGIIYSTGTTMAVLSGTSTANQILLSGASGAPSWSTSTYPSSAGSNNNLLQSNGTNWVSVTPPTTPTASSIASWDANKNFSANNLLDGYTLTASSGTLTLTVASAGIQVISGSSAQTVQMPVVSTLATGQVFTIINISTQTVPIQSSGTNAIISLPPNTQAVLTCVFNTGTTASSWNAAFSNTTVTVPVTEGGTGLTTLTTAYAPVCAGTTATGNLQVASTGLSTSGALLASNGSSALPSFKTNGTLGLITQVTKQVFTSSGTYTPTTGMVYCIVEAQGGGGGGGGSTGANTQSGSAGGGACGGYSRVLLTAASIGASKTVTIGSGGSGGTAGTNSGGNGTATSMTTLCVANGGGGGAGGAASATTNFGAPGSAASAGTGDIALAGSAGGFGFAFGSVAIGIGGAGTAGHYGGGVGSPVNAAGNNAANNTGSGGSGAGTGAAGSLAGGNGGSGLLIVTEFLAV